MAKAMTPMNPRGMSWGSAFKIESGLGRGTKTPASGKSKMNTAIQTGAISSGGMKSGARMKSAAMKMKKGRSVTGY